MNFLTLAYSQDDGTTCIRTVCAASERDIRMQAFRLRCRRRILLVSCILFMVPARTFLQEPPLGAVIALFAGLFLATHIGVYLLAKGHVSSPERLQNNKELSSFPEDLEDGRELGGRHGLHLPSERFRQTHFFRGLSPIDEDNRALQPSKLSECMEEVALLQDACDQVREEQQRLSADLQEASQGVADIEAHRQQLTSQLAQAQAELPKYADETALAEAAARHAAIHKDELLSALRLAESSISSQEEAKTLALEQQTRFSEEMASLMEEMGSAEVTVQQLDLDKNILMGNIHYASEGLSSMEVQYRDLLAEQTELQLGLQQNKDTHSEITRQQGMLESQVVQAHAEMRAVQEAINQALADKEIVHDGLQSTQAQLCAAQQDSAQLRSSHRQLDDETKCLKTQLAEAHASKAELLKGLSRAAAEVDEAEEARVQMLAKHQQLKEDLTRAGVEHAEFQKKQESLHADLRSATDECSSLKGEHKAAQEELCRLNEHARVAEASTKKVEMESAELREEFHDINRKLTGAREVAATIAREREAAEAASKEVHGLIASAHEAMLEAASERRRGESELEQCLATAASCQKELDSLHAARNGHDEAAASLRQSLADAQADRAAVHQKVESHSKGLQECEADIAMMRMQVTESQQERTVVTDNLTKLCNDLAQAEVDRRQLRIEHEASRTELQTCMDAAARASRDADAARSDHAELIVKLEEVRTELDNARGGRTQAEEEMRKSRAGVEDCLGRVAALRSEVAAAENDRRRLLGAVESLRKDFDSAETERICIRTEQAESSAALAQCAGQVDMLKSELSADRSELQSRLARLHEELCDAAHSAAIEEVMPLRQDLGKLQRQVDQHAEAISVLQTNGFEKSTAALSPRSSRSPSLYDESESICGVSSSGASTPTGSMRRSRILQGGSFCSSVGSDSEASSFASRPILAGRSFASSDGGDDLASERSFDSSRSSIYAALASPSLEPQASSGNFDAMAYAQAVKPLLVTRKDLARVLARVPPEVLMSKGDASCGYSDLRELVATVFKSIVVLGHVPGSGDHLCFGHSVSYTGTPYQLGRLQMSMTLHASPAFVVPGKVRFPKSVPEGEDVVDTEASLQPTTPSATMVDVRLIEVSSHELFLAELVGPFRPALQSAASHPQCSEKALRHRRHALRHAKAALGLALKAAGDK